MGKWRGDKDAKGWQRSARHFYEQSFVPEQFHFDSVADGESSWKRLHHTVSRCRKLSLSCVFALRLGNTASIQCLLESAAPTDECKVISAGCGCFVSILLPPTFDLRRLMFSALVKLKLTNFGCCCVWVLTAWTFIRLILCICACVW